MREVVEKSKKNIFARDVSLDLNYMEVNNCSKNIRDLRNNMKMRKNWGALVKTDAMLWNAFVFLLGELSDAHFYAPINNLLQHTQLWDKTLLKKSNFTWHKCLSFEVRECTSFRKQLSGFHRQLTLLEPCKTPIARGEKL